MALPSAGTPWRMTMDAFMDALWDKIMGITLYAASLFDQLLAPLHIFGPVCILALLAVLTILVTKLLNRVVVTRRYVELEKQFKYWYAIREEAMKGEDYEEARRLARNIDQAKLNRVYYDYFLEGFLLGLVRNVLPIILMVAYINEYYRAERLLDLFGRNYVLQISQNSGEPLLIGSVFCYIVALLVGYLLWAVVGRMLRSGKKTKSCSSLIQAGGKGTASHETFLNAAQ